MNFSALYYYRKLRTCPDHVLFVALVLVQVGLWACFRVLFYCVQQMSWIIHGTRSEYVRSRLPQNYKTSAQVMTIDYRFGYAILAVDGVGKLSNVHFCCSHSHWAHPNVTLGDDFFLFHVDERDAYFIQTNTSKRVWSIDESAFLNCAQYHQGVRVVRMPITSLLTLAEEVPRRQARLVFVHNTGRCGGTLLLKVFERTKECVVLSEPSALSSVIAQHLGRGTWTKDQAKPIIRAVVTLLCKPLSYMDHVSAYVIKPRADYSIAAAPLLQSVVPDSVNLFSYRNPLHTARSFHKFTHVIPAFVLYRLFFPICNHISSYSFTKRMVRTWALVNWLDGTLPNASPLTVFYAAILYQFRTYTRQVAAGGAVRGVRYEDVVRHPQEAVGKLLTHCGLPRRLLPAALSALDGDSQEKSPYSRAEISQYRHSAPDPLDSRAAGLCEEYGMPHPGTDFLLPGTISCTGGTSNGDLRTRGQ